VYELVSYPTVSKDIRVRITDLTINTNMPINTKYDYKDIVLYSS